MDTAPPDTTRLFFQYLREINWRASPWWLAPGDPRRKLLDLIIQVPVPIYLGQLTRKHMAYQIGLWSHLWPIQGTVRPSNEEAMDMMLAQQGFRLVPPYVLGATIHGQGRQPPVALREFAQLGVVMVRTDRDASWRRTEFVFAAEIDANGNVFELWMLQHDEPPPSDGDGVNGPTLKSYDFFDLLTIANLPERCDRAQFQLFKLFYGVDGWRQKTQAGEDLDMGFVGLHWVEHQGLIHFVRVAQNSTGYFKHATRVKRDLTDPSTVSSRPFWICMWYSRHRETGCTAINPHN